jgi:hypothetical protein
MKAPDLRTVDTLEAARLVGRAPQTLRNWSCHPGIAPIHPVKIGRRGGPLRWRLADIERLILGAAETAIDDPFDADASMKIDRALISVEGARLVD